MDFLDKILDLFLNNPPWWIYLVSVLIPLCVLITVREFMCWFCKINKLVGRLERIDKSLTRLANAQKAVPKSAAQQSKKTEDSDFTLD